GNNHVANKIVKPTRKRINGNTNDAMPNQLFTNCSATTAPSFPNQFSTCNELLKSKSHADVAPATAWSSRHVKRSDVNAMTRKNDINIKTSALILCVRSSARKFLNA